VVGFLIEPQNQGGGGFPGLGLKTGSYSLVIRTSKSPRQFLDLGLKTYQASVCRLHNKIDGGREAWDTRLDLAACFTWKQVGLVFPSLSFRLVGARRRVVYVAPSRRLRRSQVEDGRIDTTDYIGPYYPCFTIFYVLCHSGMVVI
jgi:hypothetical protein